MTDSEFDTWCSHAINKMRCVVTDEHEREVREALREAAEQKAPREESYNEYMIREHTPPEMRHGNLDYALATHTRPPRVLDEAELEKLIRADFSEAHPFFIEGARYAACQNLRLAIESVKLTDSEILDRAIEEAAVLGDPDKRALVKASYVLGALESFDELKRRLEAV